MHKGVIVVKHREPGVQRGFKMGKRGMKSGSLTIRKWKAKEQHKHNGGNSALNKNALYWPPGKWAGGDVK